MHNSVTGPLVRGDYVVHVVHDYVVHYIVSNTRWSKNVNTPFNIPGWRGDWTSLWKGVNADPTLLQTGERGSRPLQRGTTVCRTKLFPHSSGNLGATTFRSQGSLLELPWSDCPQNTKKSYQVIPPTSFNLFLVIIIQPAVCTTYSLICLVDCSWIPP